MSVIAFIALVLPVQGQVSPEGSVTTIDDLAALLIHAETEEEVDGIIATGSEAGLSDIQIGSAFGLALEYLLQEGPRERLPVVMSSFEAFVADSSESVMAISNALEAGQNLARNRADAGAPMISPPVVTTEGRPPESRLHSSPVGGGASARGATGGGGGGVVSGGASPS